MQNIGCAYQVWASGKYSAGAARSCHGMSRTSPMTPTMVRSSPQRLIRDPTAASGEAQYLRARLSLMSSTIGALFTSDALSSRPATIGVPVAPMYSGEMK